MRTLRIGACGRRGRAVDAAAVGAATLLVVAGCGLRPAEVAPPTDDPPSHARTILAQAGFLEVKIEAPDHPPGPKPAVISYLADARPALLRAGIVIVSYSIHWELLRGTPPAAATAPPSPPPPPPAPPAAKPVGKWLLASPTPKTIGKGYFSLIDGAARGAVRDVLDILASDPDVDPARIGIAGFSTNGFTALQATSVDPRLRVAVAIAACGDYHRFLHHSSLAMAGEPLDLDPDYDAWLREIEPMRHPARLAHAAVLMVNGRTDRPIPIGCAQSTARALRRAYRYARAPDRFRFVVVDDGHALGPRARDEAIRWLTRWLGVAAPP